MFERMARLVEAGALIQATADFLLREATAEGMRALAERRLVHVLSSDAHSSHGGRPVHLSEAFARLGEVEALAPHLGWIAETAPRAIVAGDELDAAVRPRRLIAGAFLVPWGARRRPDPV